MLSGIVSSVGMVITAVVPLQADIMEVGLSSGFTSVAFRGFALGFAGRVLKQRVWVWAFIHQGRRPAASRHHERYLSRHRYGYHTVEP